MKYLIVNGDLIDPCDRREAIGHLVPIRGAGHRSLARVIVLPDGYDPEVLANNMRIPPDEGFDYIAILGQIVSGQPPVDVRQSFRDGYDLFIGGRRAGGAHTAEFAIINAERLIWGDLEPCQTFVMGR